MDTHDPTQQHLAAIVEGTEDAIVTKDLNSIITSWNRGAERLFGFTAQEAIGQPITIVFPEDRKDEEEGLIARLRRGERIVNFETIRQRKDGELIPVSLTISPVRDGDGTIVGASKIARDISVQHQLAKQQSLLLSEMRHRVGNAFAIASALISVAAREAESIEQLRSEMRSRLSAIAALNSMTVSATGDTRPERMSLGDLVLEITSPFGDGENIRTSLPDIEVKQDAITPLTLVFFELATNSVKYGGLSSEGDGVEISGVIDGDRLKIEWKEACVIADDPSAIARKGFGTSLCNLTVSTSLGGTFSREFAPSGLVASLDVELARVKQPFRKFGKSLHT